MSATVLVASGCSTNAAQFTQLPVPDDATFTPQQQVQAPDTALQAAVTLAHALSEEGGSQRGQNTVNSPLSAIIALSLLSEGASPTAQAQLETVTGLPSSQRAQIVNGWISTIKQWDRLDEFDPDALPPTPIVHLANQIAIDNETQPAEEYLRTLSRAYDARAIQMDLGAASSKKVLDSWVEKHTGGLIKESAIQPREDLKLVLANAILFAAGWEEPFEGESTSPQPFTTASGEVVTTDTMTGDLYTVVAEESGWLAAQLRYQDGLEATVILPPVGTLPDQLTAPMYEKLIAKIDSGQPQDVELSLPKYETTSTLDLAKVMKKLGATEVFQPEARPLPQLDTEDDLAVGEAIQQARIEVNEDGTKAAAVTEIGVKVMGMPVEGEEIRIDRPFLTVVRSQDLPVPLFWAQIGNPKTGQ